MPPIGLAASLGLGAPRAATSSGSVHSAVDLDEDAQTYFTALQGTTGWVAPSDYADKKTAISNYVTDCKTAGNWEKIKALYIPIWQAAGPNELSAKRSEDGSAVTTYDLTFNGTVTHNNGDYIQGDGTTGYANAAFEGPDGDPTFMTLTDFSYSGNVLGGTLTTYDCLLGWYREGSILPTFNATSNVGAYTWDYNVQNSTANGGTVGFWSVESQTPTGSNTNKFELWKDGSSMLTKESVSGSIFSDGGDWTLLAASRWNVTPPAQQHGQYQVNFAHVGLKMASQSDFNTDTATLLAAL